MAYALVGIPLGLVMFQSIGERLNNFSSFVIRNVKRVLKYDSIEASETNLILVVTVCHPEISIILATQPMILKGLCESLLISNILECVLAK